MRRFKFRLNTNLKVVRIREELHRQELHRQLTAYNQAKDRLRCLEAQYLELENELREINGQKPVLELIRLFRDYMAVVNLLRKRQRAEVLELEAELSRCRARMKKLLQERKLLERLKNRRWSEYQKEVRIEEQKQVDEMAINRFLNFRTP